MSMTIRGFRRCGDSFSASLPLFLRGRRAGRGDPGERSLHGHSQRRCARPLRRHFLYYIILYYIILYYIICGLFVGIVCGLAASIAAIEESSPPVVGISNSLSASIMHRHCLRSCCQSQSRKTSVNILRQPEDTATASEELCGGQTE